MRNPFEPYRPPPATDPKTLKEDPPTAHETAAVLRMQRQGMSGDQICKELDISKQQLVYELTLALDDEVEAHRRGMPIHDAGLPTDPALRANYLRLHG